MPNDVFQTQCPHCLAEYELPVSLKGRKAQCKKCRKTFLLVERDAELDELLKTPEPFVAPPSTAAERAPSDAKNLARTPNLAEPNDLSPSGASALANGSVQTSASSSNALDSEKSDSYREFDDELSASEASGDSSESSDSSNESADDSSNEFDVSDERDVPPGVWRAGEKLLGGAYRVLPLAPGKLFAEGGVGVVQRVRHREWGVDLVVKSPKPNVVLTETGKESFERECQTWIELGLHENIVVCYFVRRIDGTPRLFAELAPDGTLRDWILDGRLYEGGPRRALARILDFSIQFAWGLEHAHRQGLLHLDVKPSNVMTSGTTVKVTDFGLSKVARANADGSFSTDLCEGMTPAYCSPEQYEAFQLFKLRRKTGALGNAPNANAPLSSAPVGGSTVPITVRSDIWSWAISILAMFHGRSPCKLGGQTAAEVFEVFLTKTPPPERPAIPPGLVDLLRRCFRKNPAERPESMQAIADRLVAIYESEIGEKFPRRQPRDAASTAESFSNRAISLVDLGKTEEALDLLRRAVALNPQQPLVAFNRELSLWRAGKIDDKRAISGLNDLTRRRPQDATAQYALGLLRLESGNVRSALETFRAALELAPDRADLASALERSNALLPLDARGLERFVLRQPIDDEKKPSLFVDRAGKFLLVETNDGKFSVLKIRNGKLQSRFSPSSASSGEVSDYPRPFAVSEDYRWKLFETAPNAVAIAPAGRRRSKLGTGSREIYFDAAPWRVLAPIEFAVPAEEVAPNSLNSPNPSQPARDSKTATSETDDLLNPAPRIVVPGRKLAVGRNARGIVVVDAEKKRSLQLLAPGEDVSAFAVSTDGRWLAIGDRSAQVRLWDVENGRCVRTFAGVAGPVEALWFDPARRSVVSLSKGTTLQFWSVDALCNRAAKLRAPHLLCVVNSSEELGERRAKLDDLLDKARAANRAGNVAQIVDAYRRAKTVDGWETFRSAFEAEIGRRAFRSQLDDAVLTRRATGHDGPASALVIPWDGSFAVSAGKDAVVRLWGAPPPSDDASDSADADPAELPWKVLAELDGHFDWVRALAISPNGRFLASGGWDKRVILWDLATGKKLRELPESFKGLSKLAFAPDGRTLAVATEAGNVFLCDAATNETVFRIQADDGPLRSLRFNRDGRFFATAGADKAVRFWTGRTEIPAREIGGFPAAVWSIDVSCDLRLLAAGCANGKIYLVDLTDPTGQTRRVLPGHLGGVETLRLFPDADWLVSGGKDQTARVWNLRDDSEAKTLQGADGAISTVEVDFDARSIFAACETGVLKRWSLRWDFEAPAASEPNRSPERLTRLVGTLAAYYAVGGELAARRTPSKAYYGRGATAFARKFTNDFPLTERGLKNIFAELAYRGFGGLPFETVREIAADLWAREAEIRAF